MRLLIFLCTFLSAFPLYAQTAPYCLNQLPEKLRLEKGAPQSAQFVLADKNLIDFEKMTNGTGWGYALKYQNDYCEVLVHAYNRSKTQLTDADVDEEIAYFDGFEPLGKFEKEVGYDVFKGLIGSAHLDDSAEGQPQIVAITKAGNYFVKYRASCRAIEGIDEQGNFRLSDAFITQAMKASFGQLAFCLRGQKLSD